MQRLIYILGLIVFSTPFLFAQSATWQRSEIYGGGVEDVLIMNSGTMIAATTNGGVYRSTDEGETWTHLPESKDAPFLFNIPWCLAKGAQNELYVGTNYGLYRSTDEGDTWTKHNEGLTVTRITALLPVGGSTLLAGTYNGGMYRSTDRGENWTEINNGLTMQTVNDLAMDSGGGIYVGTESGVFRSSDNGDNWSEKNNGLQSSAVQSFFITPGDTVLAGTRSGPFISTDLGETWVQGVSFGSHYAVYADPNGTFFSGTNTGFVFASTDRGANYTTRTKVPYALFHKLQAAPGGGLLAATGTYGVIESNDGGNSWMEKDNGLTANKVVDLIATDAGIFAGTEEGIYHSTDHGATWTRHFDEEAGVNLRAFGSSATGRLFCSPGQKVSMSDDNGKTWFLADSTITETWADSFGFGPNNTIYASYYDGIFRSTNNGASWTEISRIEGVVKQVTFVTPAGSILIGTRKSGVYRSTDGGSNFTQVPSAGWDYDDHKAFLVDDNGDILLACFDGVFLSTDDGAGWTKLGTVPTYGVKDIALDSDGNLYIAMRGGGVAVSLDDGATWIPINEGLQHLDATCLYVDEMDNVFVGTRGGGVFTARLSTTDVPQVLPRPEVATLQQNYPNPFNPTTTIPFTLASPADVSLTVHDVLGRHVATLAQKRYDAGSHRVRFEARDLAGGIYTARLTVNGSVSTMRMLLLR